MDLLNPNKNDITADEKEISNDKVIHKSYINQPTEKRDNSPSKL